MKVVDDESLSGIQTDPIKAAETAGMLLGLHPTEFQRFARSHGLTLFENERIRERIDFLLPPKKGEYLTFAPKDLEVFKENIEWECLDDDSIVIRDINYQFESMRLNLGVDQDEVYFIIDDYGNEWQFYCGDGRFDIPDPLDGFMNIHRTRMVVFMIRWVTNLLNFSS